MRVWGAVCDVDACGDEECVDIEAFWACLCGDHFVAQHEISGGGGFGWGVNEFDEAGFASASGEDLGFDDGEGGAGLGGDVGVDFGGVVWVGEGVASGDGDAEGGEEVACLVFVDFHRWGPSCLMIGG